MLGFPKKEVVVHNLCLPKKFDLRGLFSIISIKSEKRSLIETITHGQNICPVLSFQGQASLRFHCASYKLTRKQAK